MAPTAQEIVNETHRAIFWALVDRPSPYSCWEWLGSRNPEGYGLWRPGNGQQPLMSHRVAYEDLVGPIPHGLVLDHLCRNPPCVNPLHLEPVTQRTNLLRGYGRAAMNARKTHCVRGHPFSEENTWVYRGQRLCRTCRVNTTREWRTRRGAHSR